MIYLSKKGMDKHHHQQQTLPTTDEHWERRELLVVTTTSSWSPAAVSTTTSRSPVVAEEPATGSHVAGNGGLRTKSESPIMIMKESTCCCANGMLMTLCKTPAYEALEGGGIIGLWSRHRRCSQWGKGESDWGRAEGTRREDEQGEGKVRETVRVWSFIMHHRYWLH